jgi:hypothetical protein
MTEPNQVFQINRIRDWFKDKWGNADSENVPLLNRERGTMEAPQRSNFRNIVTAAVFILVVVVVGLIIGFSIDGDNQSNGMHTF